jgi:MFS family permease
MAEFRVRFFILFLCVTATSISYIARTNINIAIVSMVEDPIASAQSSGNTSVPDVCVRIEPKGQSGDKSSILKSGIDDEPKHKKHKWDQKFQGLVLGAFFYPYIMLQMPSGRMAEKYGGRFLITACLLGSGIINLITPLITEYWVLMLISRILLGTVQCGLFPSAFMMQCKWMPLKDRSLAFALLEAGGFCGSIITYFCAGFLSKSLGWPSVFYFAGGIALIYAFIFTLLTRSSPEEHPFVSQAEMKVIHSNESGRPEADPEKVEKIPYFRILTSRPVLVAAFFKFNISWMCMISWSKLPAYLNDVIREDITSNGVILAFINVLSALTMATGGYISERMIERNWLSRTKTRKLFGVTSGLGNALCIALIPTIGCDRAMLLASLFLGSIFLGCGSASEVPLASEMSKNFPATIYAIMNMIAMSAGFLAPSFVGFVLDSTPDLIFGWRIVFYFTSCLSVIATTIFVCFAEAKRQPFDVRKRGKSLSVEENGRKEEQGDEVCDDQSQDENMNDPDMQSNHLEVYARRLSQLP